MVFAQIITFVMTVDLKGNEKRIIVEISVLYGFY